MQFAALASGENQFRNPRAAKQQRQQRRRSDDRSGSRNRDCGASVKRLLVVDLASSLVAPLLLEKVFETTEAVGYGENPAHGSLRGHPWSCLYILTSISIARSRKQMQLLFRAVSTCHGRGLTCCAAGSLARASSQPAKTHAAQGRSEKKLEKMKIFKKETLRSNQRGLVAGRGCSFPASLIAGVCGSVLIDQRRARATEGNTKC